MKIIPLPGVWTGHENITRHSSQETRVIRLQRSYIIKEWHLLHWAVSCPNKCSIAPNKLHEQGRHADIAV